MSKEKMQMWEPIPMRDKATPFGTKGTASESPLPACSGRQRHRLASGLLLSLLMSSAFGLSTPALAENQTNYDALILRARAGDYEPALTMLRQQPATNTRAAYDRIVIAGWAGKPEETIATFEAMHPRPALPADVLQTVARAYRDTYRWPEALALYREGMRRFPSDASFAQGEVMVLADSGQEKLAVAHGEALTKRMPSNADNRLALGYAYLRLHAPFAALHEVDQAHTLAPNKGYVTREYVLSLQRAGMPDAALRVAREHPDLFNASQMRGFEGDAVAEQVRLASMPTRSEAERFVIADRALAQYDKLIPAWEKLGPDAHDDVVRLRIDRLNALHARVRMRELINEYEALRDAGVHVPRYVLDDVASTYLYLREPEKARDIYTRVAEGDEAGNDDPADRLRNESGLYYAYAEGEQNDEAGKMVKVVQSAFQPWLYYKGQPGRMPSDLYLESQQMGASAYLQAGDTPAAQQSLERMVENAPNNSGLRADLATVYRARELPRLSERTLKIAETQAPRNLSVENGQGFTALDLQEWRQAEALSADTIARYPENLGAQRLARLWEVHNKAELRVTGYRGISSDSPVSGSGDFGIDTVLYSRPIDYNWRVFGGGGYANGKFQEGNGNYRWLRTGVEWRGRDLTMEGEVSTNDYGFGTKPGLRLSAAYDLNDHWQVGGAGEILSRETPLRALASDVSSNRLNAFVRWRGDERREWTFSVSPSRFSDGNNRIEAGLLGRERIYTSPRVMADLLLDLSTSHNSKGNDVPYFNPRSDLTMVPSVKLTHVLYRRYETVWEQIGTLGAGTYSQQGYGTGGIVAVGYGQRYRANDVLDMGAMVTGISRPYDGQREREVRIVFDLNYRF